MKFWNKSKKTREKCWTIVGGPTGSLNPYDQLAYYRAKEMKRWCQQNTSTGKFYFGEPMFFGVYPPWTVHWPWYFENSEDALAFKLKFLGTKSEVKI